MGRIVAIFLVMCLIAAFLHESEAYGRNRNRREHRSLRGSKLLKEQTLYQRNMLHNRSPDHNDRQDTDQLVADNMENERKTELENDLETDEMETKLDDHYYDEEI
ncbi:hypothetical protein OS493_035849 [Desmophyllum pertusum]|uniref:Uncharacterized protein n=1 Tax=Desmophyllum pertusum TaxID=174260 RepID=A0A9X0D8F4_9CNID|nr:hypothetical protein OS493_035849 [Desmophyllum pertusum]